MMEEDKAWDLHGAGDVCKTSSKGSTPSHASKPQWFYPWMEGVKKYHPGQEFSFCEITDVLDRISMLQDELAFLTQKVREFYMLDEFERSRIMQNDYKELSIRYSKLFRTKRS